ncbi:putative isoflavone-7-O-beta-glucoside 6''-O-malonyltransferase [Medicago truncatula]|uniref:Putative isoflavone-7-O-beta-glucoside 6''-O-malonyltransferase n=1 Tax=Medicago truncatula TaxID=3880 RepID=A0A396HBZ7_MEDTR|nr:putative isoflavone-7-O-beta-glucoside 6''-O-malonyltransferase [Medicago truncatula]
MNTQIYQPLLFLIPFFQISNTLFLLVGNITWPQDSSHPIINYVPSDSIPLIVAESNENFNLLCSNFCEVEKKQHLIPSLEISNEKASIISLQVTFFPNHGFCIGITTHHAAVDGKSSTLFMKAWSYFCSNLEKNTPSLSLPQHLTPFFDRSIIRDPVGINEIYSKGWLNFGGETNNRSLKVWEIISATKGETIKGSPRFEVYSFDFGWGKPKKVDVTSIDKTGAFSLSENRNNDGGV